MRAYISTYTHRLTYVICVISPGFFVTSKTGVCILQKSTVIHIQFGDEWP